VPPAGKKTSSDEFPAIVVPDAHGDFHLGAKINGVFIAFSSISRVHAQALAAKQVVIAASSSSESEGEQ